MIARSPWPLTALLLGFAACGGESATPTPSAGAEQAPPPLDDGGYGDLVDAPGMNLVVLHCVRCHGPRQFLQQRGSRDTWRGLIRWMQKDHGMEHLADDQEDRIIEYLATHYGPKATGRRRPIPADLMPPNPYGPTANEHGR